MTIMYTRRSATLDPVNMNTTTCCASTLKAGCETREFEVEAGARGRAALPLTAPFLPCSATTLTSLTMIPPNHGDRRVPSSERKAHGATRTFRANGATRTSHGDAFLRCRWPRPATTSSTSDRLQPGPLPTG